jgi:hypothetical protein
MSGEQRVETGFSRDSFVQAVPAGLGHVRRPMSMQHMHVGWFHPS